ncbi:MAG: NUDIX hydrolase [Thermoflexaceae bacterium]|nr:NUDIX hydrolase [Thermoflexaceae bacterium]
MFERLDRELVYKGSILDVYQDSVKVPNGNIAKWDFIKHKGAAAVLPVTDEGKIVMVKQYRNAIDRDSLEIPAGGRNGADEPTIVAAARELEEETGYKSEDLELLLSTVPAIAYSSEVIDIYIARNLKPSRQHLDEDEFVDVCEYTLDELCEMIYSCKIQDSKTIAAIMTYKAKFGR